MHALAVGHGPVSRLVNAAIKALTPQGARRQLLEMARRRIVYSGPPAVDEQLTAELRQRFRPEVEALSDYLSRDLVTLWGYDRVA